MDKTPFCPTYGKIMGILLAIFAGLGMGYIFERGDFCFHSTWRGVFSRPRRLDLVRAYLLSLLIGIPLVQGMTALGWIDPWIPPFAWQANLVGGFIFGVGMVVGATCITGLFYKLGHGMLGVLAGLAAWAVGDVITYLGPLRPLRDWLNAAPVAVNGESATVTNLSGIIGWVLLIGVGVGTAVYLYRSPRQDRGKLWNWLILGTITGLFTSAAWLLARSGGADYTFGTSGVPSGVVTALAGNSSGDNIWIPLALVSLVPGAFVAARRADTLWIRGETARRYGELAVGGFLMGVGAGIAGGCNLGHSLVGVPLLSLGSITSTLAMGAGVFLADRALKIWRGQRQQTAHATS